MSAKLWSAAQVATSAAPAWLGSAQALPLLARLGLIGNMPACTDNTTNYIVAHRSTRAVTTATTTTNWNATTTYGRIGRAVFASGVLTYYDERFGTGGIFDHSTAAAGDVVGPGKGTGKRGQRGRGCAGARSGHSVLQVRPACSAVRRRGITQRDHPE